MWPIAIGMIGAWTSVSAPFRPPPSMRREGFREGLCVLSKPGQVGCPASMNTGATQGFAAMVYKSASLLFKSRGAQRYPLARVAGQATEGHQAAKKDLA